MSRLITYRKPWPVYQSLEANFPNGDKRSFRTDIVNPAGVIIARETRNVYVPFYTGVEGESLEYAVLWKQKLNKYYDLAGVAAEDRFTVAEDFLQGRALSCFRRLRDKVIDLLVLTCPPSQSTEP